MNDRTVGTIGMVMPDDFAIEPYNAAHTLMNELQDKHLGAWREWAAAWNAVAYRFLAVADHDAEFTRSVRDGGNSPAPANRYRQERELFEFFVNGLSAIESLSYAIFFIGSIVNTALFPVRTEAEVRAIDPNSTLRVLRSTFPDDSLTGSLRKTLRSKQYSEWNKARNVLAHRGAPGRQFIRGGPNDGAALWLRGVEINEDTTASRRTWFAPRLNTLLSDTYAFARLRLN